MAIPIIGALVAKIGAGASAAKTALASRGKDLLSNALASGASGSPDAPGGVFSIPALPKMDGGFYGHSSATSIPPKGLKGQLSPVGIKADAVSAKTRVPSAKSMKGSC